MTSWHSSVDVGAGVMCAADMGLNSFDPGPADWARLVTRMDLSNNALTEPPPFEAFPNLETLVLDGNLLTAECFCEMSPTLRVLWVNRNLIAELVVRAFMRRRCGGSLQQMFLKYCGECLPSLQYLSLLSNPCHPLSNSDVSEATMRQFRLTVLTILPELHFLDDACVRSDDRVVAQMWASCSGFLSYIDAGRSQSSREDQRSLACHRRQHRRSPERRSREWERRRGGH